ncbi:hypothetical protein [Sorangium cellulosum]|nr:hypothetical protein [Sorangium cellulosum]
MVPLGELMDATAAIAHLAVRELSGTIAELRRERLDAQLARARTLRRAVLASWGYDDTAAPCPEVVADEVPLGL